MRDDVVPEIDYPCRWTYQVIGADEHALRAAVGEVVEAREHTVEFSRKSSKGKYLSLRVEVVVHDHDERRGIATSLMQHADVRIVL